MSNIVAGIGRGQLKVLEQRIQKKRDIYHFYQDAFKDIGDITMMPIHDEWERSNCWLSCILIDKNSSVTPLMIMETLEKENVETRPIWKPMHLQPVFKSADYIDNGGVSEYLFDYGVCLPSDTKMTVEQQTFVCEMIKSLWK